MMKENFNSYKDDVNLDFLRQYCLRNGKAKMIKRGEIFVRVGEPSHHIGYIEKGCFKLLVSGKQYKKYPKCLKHSTSDILFFL